MKGYWKQFVIPFKGLKEGIHKFDFDINHMFFEGFDYSILKQGKVKVHLEMEKKTTMLVFSFSIHGTINLQCDRCLDNYKQAIDGEQLLIAKYTERESDPSSEDIVVLSEEAHEFDVSQYIYEFISLLLPIKHVHQNPQDCNQDMIAYLDKENANDASLDHIDERWKALEEVKRKMNNK
ncbi:MAG: DUF177 domain-containing protein [Bacteroidales bacterium]